MRGIILAGGLGTRLRPVIGENLPKCMAPVMGRPMIDLIIRNMKKQGINDITLSLGYKAEAFLEKYGHMKYKIEPEPLGTGGAIKYCIEPEETDPILVVNGDTITHVDYGDLLAHHMPPLTVVTNPLGVSAGIYILNPEILEAYNGAFSFERDVIPNMPHQTYEIAWFIDYGTPEAYNNAPKEWI